MSERIIDAIAATAEIMGASLSTTALGAMARDLSEYPEAAVFKALKRVRMEGKGQLALADILKRIDDGRPGAEEAWGMYPKDEDGSAVVTNEMQLAMRHAWPLVQDGDKIAARMAFKESYERIVSENRAEGLKPRWEVTLGEDRSGRESALIEAVEKQRLTADHAMRLLPPEAHERVLRAAGEHNHPLLAPPTEGQKRNQRALKGMVQTATGQFSATRSDDQG